VGPWGLGATVRSPQSSKSSESLSRLFGTSRPPATGEASGEKYGKKDSLRRRGVDLVIQELVQAKAKHGIKAVLFYDDVFTTHPKWMKEFAPRYKAEVGLPFWAYTYPRTTRKEDILMLKDAGLQSMTMGIQSGSRTVLAEYNRPVPPEMSIKAAQDLVDCGVTAYFDLITQSEFEGAESCRETFNFLLDLPREMRTVGFYPMVRFPGFGYTRKVEEQQRTVALDEKSYTYYHKLYLLTRSKLPRRMIEAIGRSKLVRRFPSLIDPFLDKELPFLYLEASILDTQSGDAIEVTYAPPDTAEIPDRVPFTTPAIAQQHQHTPR